MSYFDGIVAFMEHLDCVYGTPEVGWSSEHTATKFLARPYPRVYEHDVVRDRNGRVGTIVNEPGPWLELESHAPPDEPVFWEIRLDEVAEVVWSRPA